MTPHLASDTTFSPDSRVWVYTAHRTLSDAESAWVTERLHAFCRQWTAHNQALRASAEIFENQYLILLVDETQAGASGCSIDKSVHFLEALGREIDADFFERMRFGWIAADGALHLSSREQFAHLLQAGGIAADTLVTNPLVTTRRELAEKWLLPFGQSWHKRLF